MPDKNGGFKLFFKILRHLFLKKPVKKEITESEIQVRALTIHHIYARDLKIGGWVTCQGRIWNKFTVGSIFPGPGPVSRTGLYVIARVAQKPWVGGLWKRIPFLQQSLNNF
jgi:hypothetical protein